MNDIDYKFVQEAMEPVKRRSVYRWAALAASFLLIFGLGMGIFFGNQAEEDDIVLPPCRVAPMKTMQILDKKYTFEVAWEDAAAVAWVRIGNWIGDSSSGFATYFEAEVLQCYKGELQNQIIVKQDGSTRATISGYPLFTNGNEMLLFLGVNDVGDYTENAYWIVGSYTTVFDITADDAGNYYLVDNMNFWKNGAKENELYYVDNSALKAELFENYVDKDPYMDEIMDSFENKQICRMGDVEKLIKGIA